MSLQKVFWAVVLFALVCNRATAQSFTDTSVTVMHLSSPNLRAYSSLQLPAAGSIKPVRPIIIAIVDDAFSLTHTDCKDFYYRNPREIPGNNTDDDHNGYADDVTGYDVADGDNDVSLPKGHETYFYHGTMIMGIITRLAIQCMGPQAPAYIKILPVKAMRDNSEKPIMESGYEGIEYAVKSGADIIVCAWNGGKFDQARFQPVFDEARKKGITIIASAGNFYSHDIDPPAAISTVYAVAAIDTAFKKNPKSNYGPKIDLTAAGENVYTAHPFKDNAHFYGEGTSSSAALVAGCAAMLKLAKPDASPYDIFAALKNTAMPLDSINRYYGGKLGAGLPQLSDALNYLMYPEKRPRYFNGARCTGDIILNKKSAGQTWNLHPAGGYTSYTFKLAGKAKDNTSYRLNFYTADTLYASYALNQFPLKLEVPGLAVKITGSGKYNSHDIILNYTANPIDSTVLYCSGTQYFNTPTASFDDGSGDNEYVNNCSCKWVITVAEGKHIRLEFDKFDTQAKVDQVYIYQGTKTLSENLIARFSGPDLPPVITTSYNQVLVWFVTDPTITAKGWHLKYSTTDAPPGAVAPGK